VIELRDVRFTYGEGGFALDIDHLSVASGQQVCWTGPSGCGKTTLLHLVAGIFSADSGCVHTCGVELSALGDAARRDFRIANVGLVFQDFALLEYLSVLDNILLPYRISRTLRLDNAANSRAREVATQVGIGDLLDRKPNELSQGERQRVAVCRAIITRPKLLLADEPTANLDRKNATRVLDALESYVGEHRATLVVVSHDRDTIASFDVTIDLEEFCPPAFPEERGGRNRVR
jgi:putative ABC transport system ATP-binding protein